MARVIEANATYTGGNIYQYTGVLDNGNYFQTWTDYEDYIQELDTDPAYDYASDPNKFSSLMATFLRTMSAACKNGGLWCGDVLSDE